MREYLGFLAGKCFLFWWNICGRLNPDMAIGVIREMVKEWDIKKRQMDYMAAVEKGRQINGR